MLSPCGSRNILQLSYLRANFCTLPLGFRVLLCGLPPKLHHVAIPSKAGFFLRFGFSREQWSLLADALRQHARANAVANSVADADGTTYLVEGPLQTPSGRRPSLRTVWLVETGKLAPHFITAYPLPA